jgi:hypothetical protein
LTVNNAHVFAGKYSLAVAFTTSADIEVNPCPTGIPLANYGINAKVLLVGNGLPSSGCFVHSYTNIMEYNSVEILGESWYDAPLLIPSSPMGDPAWTSPYIGLSIYCPGFIGTMYVDAVSLVK